MAEKIISPGVFTDEIDQTFLPSAVGEIGAAIVGPTVKGPALIPTVVTSYSEYQALFGDTFKSGSNYYTYLTSLTAKQYLKNSDKVTIVRILDGDFGGAKSFVPTGSGEYFTGSVPSSTVDRDVDSTANSFALHTLADGAIMNNTTTGKGGYPGGDLGTNGIITNSGSKHNIRWEVSSISPNKGTFSLLVRRGDDTHKRKQILESWNNLSLDPNSNNYIAKTIGDSKATIQGTEAEPYLEYSGSYPNKSKYVRVEVLKDTVDYLDENGNIRDNDLLGFSHLSASLPGLNSGSFSEGTNGVAGFDAIGNVVTSSAAGEDSANVAYTYNFYDDIGTQSQGFFPANDNEGKTAYNKALNLLKNQDEYDYNLLLLPGLEQTDHSAVLEKAVDVCEQRGDCFVVIDPTQYGASLTTATDEANDLDSNYAAMYWPWIQIPDNDLGKNVWVPPSVAMGGIFAFNDKVAHPWFAPAGLNRGGIDIAVQAERKLTQSNRDDLYDKNVNPIATFPGQGVTAFGQKTLQKRSTSLDRINVRRLLIKVKKFIAASSKFLVFEQNTATTRRRFLNIVNPFMEQVQAQSGVNAFRVVMDATNNTPDVVDRNILYGQIFVQPTRTAEFIVLDFTVQPTGATFPE